MVAAIEFFPQRMKTKHFCCEHAETDTLGAGSLGELLRHYQVPQAGAQTIEFNARQSIVVVVEQKRCEQNNSRRPTGPHIDGGLFPFQFGFLIVGW